LIEDAQKTRLGYGDCQLLMNSANVAKFVETFNMLNEREFKLEECNFNPKETCQTIQDGSVDFDKKSNKSN